MGFEFHYVWEAIPILLQGVKLTLLISILGLLGGFFIGLFLGIIRAFSKNLLNGFALIFIEIIRGTPIVVQVMFIYFALPMILPIRVDPVLAAIITIIINSSAYIAEITRGAILSIHQGFKEAGLAMGLSVEKRCFLLYSL